VVRVRVHPYPLIFLHSQGEPIERHLFTLSLFFLPRSLLSLQLPLRSSRLVLHPALLLMDVTRRFVLCLLLRSLACDLLFALPTRGLYSCKHINRSHTHTHTHTHPHTHTHTHTHTPTENNTPDTDAHTRQEQHPKPPNEHLPKTLNKARREAYIHKEKLCVSVKPSARSPAYSSHQMLIFRRKSCVLVLTHLRDLLLTLPTRGLCS